MSDTSGSTRFTFRVRSIAALLTFDDYVVPQDNYHSYLVENDLSIGSYTIEKHRNGKDHTHIVLVSEEPTLFAAEAFHKAFGKYPHIRRLRNIDDAYRAIAYTSKHRTAQLVVKAPYNEQDVKRYILGHVFTYASRAKTQAKLAPLMEQYKRLQEEWLPPQPEEEVLVKDDSESFGTEDADKYFK